MKLESPNLTNPDKTIKDLATAIAHAEGFGIENAIPTLAHNPGDLKLPGFPTIGEEGISNFPDDDAGWARLYYQLYLIKDNLSHEYSPIMTFYDFAKKWTTTQQSEWLENILSKLNELGYKVTETTKLFTFFETSK